MLRPFEVTPAELVADLDGFVDATFADLSSAFLLLPAGDGFLDYVDFRSAYEVLKLHTGAFERLGTGEVMAALLENSRVLCVLRAMLGMTPPEWADLARAEVGSDVGQGAARSLDRRC